MRVQTWLNPKDEKKLKEVSKNKKEKGRKIEEGEVSGIQRERGGVLG